MLVRQHYVHALTLGFCAKPLLLIVSSLQALLEPLLHQNMSLATEPVLYVQWPAVHGPVRPQNASLRLYGGAAFERCLDEFQEAAHVVQFPNGKVRG